MYWRQVALHGHQPPPQLEISYQNCKVNAFIRSGWLFLCGKPIGNKLHYIKLNALAMIICQLPPTLRGRGRNFFEEEVIL